MASITRCGVITGALHIEGATDILAIHLPNLITVEGDLEIYDDGYVGSADLSGLRGVGGNLSVASLAQLTRLDLTSLADVGGSGAGAVRRVQGRRRDPDERRCGDLSLMRLLPELHSTVPAEFRSPRIAWFGGHFPRPWLRWCPW